MICITSISPSHINTGIQEKAIDTWLELGLDVYSINNKTECESLRDLYPDVKFIETTRTMEHHFGKPYVSINAVLDAFKDIDSNHLCIINSDIELRTDKETIERIGQQMNNGLVLVNRVDYTEQKEGARYLAGIDVFFIHKKYLPAFPQSLFCFGQCFWDYWIPFTALKAGIEVMFTKQNIAYHKSHNAQYSSDMWKKIGRHLLWEKELYQFNERTDIGKMSTFIYNYIYNGATRIEV